MSRIVKGSNLPPRSGKPPRQIVLLLHGYGANGADLLAFAPHWQHALPDALFIAPDAPQALGMNRFQWWPLTAFDPPALAAGAAGAAGALDAFIDRTLAEHGLSEAQLALVGFSQGTMMALHVGLRRRQQVAGIVGYSGLLAAGPGLAHEVVSRPPVLLVHGSADPVVPVAALHASKAALEKVGISVRTHVSPGVGHTVDPVGLRLGLDFLSSAFSS